MIKWIKNKIVECFIKDLIEDLPKYKLSALKLLKEKKDEVLEKIKEVAKTKLLELVEKV